MFNLFNTLFKKGSDINFLCGLNTSVLYDWLHSCSIRSGGNLQQLHVAGGNHLDQEGISV